MAEDKFEIINPPDWAAPRGYNNGMLARSGAMLFIAGQIGWNKDQQVVSDSFAAQFAQALANVVAVAEAAGGNAAAIGKLTIFVTDKQQYISEIKEVGAAYKKIMGKHFPAMALIEVRGLLEPRAKVEIEAIAVI